MNMTSGEKVDEPVKKSRRAKGDGGFVVDTPTGRVRGYKAIDGVRRYTAYFPSRQLASVALNALKAPAPLVDSHRLSAAVEIFMRNATLSSSTRGAYQHIARHYLKPLLDAECGELQYVQLQDFFHKMRLDGLSSSTMNQTKVVLAGALEQALQAGWVPVNAARLVKIPKVTKKIVVGHTGEERLRLIAATVDDDFEALWRLRLLHGLRPAESAGVTVDSIDFATGILHVIGQVQTSKVRGADGLNVGTVFARKTKTSDTGRFVTLDSETLRLLQAIVDSRARQEPLPLTEKQTERRKGQSARLAAAVSAAQIDGKIYTTCDKVNLIFRHPNSEPYNAHFDARAFTRLCAKARVDGFAPYSTRHTAATWFLSQGAPPLSVSLLLGHRDVGFTQRTYSKALSALPGGLVDFL